MWLIDLDDAQLRSGLGLTLEERPSHGPRSNVGIDASHDSGFTENVAEMIQC